MSWQLSGVPAGAHLLEATALGYTMPSVGCVWFNVVAPRPAARHAAALRTAAHSCPLPGQSTGCLRQCEHRGCCDAPAARSPAIASQGNLLDDMCAGPTGCWAGRCSGCIVYRGALADAAIANRNPCGASGLFRCKSKCDLLHGLSIVDYSHAPRAHTLAFVCNTGGHHLLAASRPIWCWTRHFCRRWCLSM
jgi:hypothetical protein